MNDLSEIRSGMQALKDSLPSTGLISDAALRQAMRKKSNWLSRVVVAEIIALPIISLLFLGMAILTGMNIWCIIVVIALAVPDVILDTRTFSVSKQWIQDESLLSLSKKLARQKVERQYQTIIGTVLAIPWLSWFCYEFLKHCAPFINPEEFLINWIVITGVALLVALTVIIIVYKKAQHTNDEMLRALRAFESE